MKHKDKLDEYMTVDEYAKQEGITRQGVYNRIGAKIINPEDVIIIPYKTKVFIKRSLNKTLDS